MADNWKSSPLISRNSTQHRTSNRSIHRDSSEYQHHKVPNPFLNSHSHSLPSELLQSVSNLEYLTPAQLQKIQISFNVNNPRRSSGFTRHLQVMQRAAKQQEMKVGPRNKKVWFEEPEMVEEASISLDEMVQEDARSRDSRHRWALEPLDMEDQSLFVNGEEWTGQPLQYYSMTSINVDRGEDDYFNL